MAQRPRRSLLDPAPARGPRGAVHGPRPSRCGSAMCAARPCWLFRDTVPCCESRLPGHLLRMHCTHSPCSPVFPRVVPRLLPRGTLRCSTPFLLHRAGAAAPPTVVSMVLATHYSSRKRGRLDGGSGHETKSTSRRRNAVDKSAASAHQASAHTHTAPGLVKTESCPNLGDEAALIEGATASLHSLPHPTATWASLEGPRPSFCRLSRPPPWPSAASLISATGTCASCCAPEPRADRE